MKTSIWNWKNNYNFQLDICRNSINQYIITKILPNSKTPKKKTLTENVLPDVLDLFWRLLSYTSFSNNFNNASKPFILKTPFKSNPKKLFFFLSDLTSCHQTRRFKHVVKKTLLQRRRQNVVPTLLNVGIRSNLKYIVKTS